MAGNRPWLPRPNLGGGRQRHRPRLLPLRRFCLCGECAGADALWEIPQSVPLGSHLAPLPARGLGHPPRDGGSCFRPGAGRRFQRGQPAFLPGRPARRQLDSERAECTPDHSRLVLRARVGLARVVGLHRRFLYHRRLSPDRRPRLRGHGVAAALRAHRAESLGRRFGAPRSRRSRPGYFRNVGFSGAADLGRRPVRIGP